VISIESKCYIPDNKCGPVDELTEVYVKEYTWNIFCLYTDIIEKVLKQRNIVYIESGDAPKEFGKSQGKSIIDRYLMLSVVSNLWACLNVKQTWAVI
jgi:hypothetical protein